MNDVIPTGKIIHCVDEKYFAFACPKTWQSLEPVLFSTVRHCNQCNRDVYLCKSPADVAYYVEKQCCIAVPVDATPDQRENGQSVDVVPNRGPHLMGYVRHSPREGESQKVVETIDVPDFLKRRR